MEIYAPQGRRRRSPGDERCEAALEQGEDHHASEGYEQHDVKRAEEIETLPIREAESIDINALIKLHIVHAAIDGKITSIILIKSVFPDLRDNLVSG
ncbi:hypothetical protein ABFT80_18285 [Mesorhizobium sp. SB112]|uniref:hypothetical protein n=1 Tax=Mesorhizobium sp. SB112 TaxID=3151853 RepID=UPI003266E6E6